MRSLPVHLKVLFQYFLSQRFVLAEGPEGVRAFFARVCEASGEPGGAGRDALENGLQVLNASIEGLGMRISAQADDETGDIYFGLVNTQATKVAEVATTYKEKELFYFRNLIERCVEEGSLSAVAALNAADTVKLSKTAAEKVLKRLVEDKWMYCAERSGSYALGPRSALELAPYIEERFQHLPECTVCQSAVLRGPECTQCHLRMHMRCARTWFSSKDSSPCPQCAKLFVFSGQLAEDIARARQRREEQHAQFDGIVL